MSDVSGLVKRLRNIMRKDSGISGDSQRIEQLTWMLFLKVFDELKESNEYELNSNEHYQSIIPEECRWRNWAVAKKDEYGRDLPTTMTGDELRDFIDLKLFPTLKNLKITDKTPKKSAIVKYVFSNLYNYMKNGVLIREVIDDLNESIDFDNMEDRHIFNEIYESILQELQDAGAAGEFYTPRPVTDFMVEMIKPKAGEKIADFACGTGGFLTSSIKYIKQNENTQKGLESIQENIIGTEWKPLPYLLCVTNMLLNGTDGTNITLGSSLAKNVDEYGDNDLVDVVLMNPPFGGEVSPGEEKNFPESVRTSKTENMFVYLILRRLKQNGRVGIILPDSFLFSKNEAADIALKTELLNKCNLHTIVKLPAGIFYANIATNILFFEKGKKTKGVWYYQVPLPEGYRSFSKTKPFKREHLDCVRKWWDNRETPDDNAYYVTMDQIEKNGYDMNFANPNKKQEIIEYSLHELVSMMDEKSKEIADSIDKLYELIGDIDE